MELHNLTKLVILYVITNEYSAIIYIIAIVVFLIEILC